MERLSQPVLAGILTAFVGFTSSSDAAVLAGTGLVRGGWPAAVGAFLVIGALILLTGLMKRPGQRQRVSELYSDS